MCQQGLLNKCVCPITLRGSLRASCTSFQRISTNWQQKWLLGSVYYVYVRLGGRALVGSNAQDLQLKPIMPAWLSVQSVSLVTAAFWKSSQGEETWKEYISLQNGQLREKKSPFCSSERNRDWEKHQNVHIAAAEWRCENTATHMQIACRRRFFIHFFINSFWRIRT